MRMFVNTDPRLFVYSESQIVLVNTIYFKFHTFKIGGLFKALHQITKFRNCPKKKILELPKLKQLQMTH